MPNLVERLFRAMILYTGLFWIVIGLWGIPASYVQWSMWDTHGILRGNELYFAMVLLLVCGSCPITGMICVGYFRKIANRQYQQIPGIADMPEPQWHNTAVFATLLATGTGLYCLDNCFHSLYNIIEPLMMIGMSLGDFTGVARLDVWYYHWQILLVAITWPICAVLLLTQTGTIAARVAQMIDTTPLPSEEPPEDLPANKPSGQGEDNEPSE
ncbi:MAG: hypothetical protein FWH27_16535 [Planctomycetaceae bacterium]|nr:hypothetical protein [Planctomycetaceae bacterium]